LSLNGVIQTSDGKSLLTVAVDKLTGLAGHAADHRELDLDVGFGITDPGKIRSESNACYLFAQPGDANTVRYGERHIYVPVDDKNHYFGVIISDRKRSSYSVPHITDMMIARPAKHVWHGSLTKSGNWTSTGNTSAFYGSYAFSVTGGDRISGTVKGSELFVRGFQLVNGGFGVVSIDGDYAAANRLPAFTPADYSAGRCRAADIGRRYMQFYASASYADAFCVATGLSDSNHVIEIEVTGTKTGSSSGMRVVVEGFAGCSITDSIGAADTYMVPIHYTSHLNGTLWSAFSSVSQFAPTGSSDYQFLGDMHADNIGSRELSTALTITVDGVDRTALIAGSFASGSTVIYSQSSTLAHKSDLASPVAVKKRVYTAMSNRPLPIMAQVTTTWSAPGAIATSYPVMLHTGVYDPMTEVLTDSVIQNYWAGGVSVGLIGDGSGAVRTVAGGSRRTLAASGNEIAVWAECVADTPPRGRMYGGSGAYTFTDRVGHDHKAYVADVMPGPIQVEAGEVHTYLIGWGGRLVT